MTHRFYVYLTGAFWFLMGAWLAFKGLKYIAAGIFDSSALLGSTRDKAALLISAGLFAGYLKGKFVLSKSAHRVAERIRSQELPLSFWKIYAPSYWLLIGSMMALGMLLNILPVPLDVRGAIDLAIGAALIRGAFTYVLPVPLNRNLQKTN